VIFASDFNVVPPFFCHSFMEIPIARIRESKVSPSAASRLQHNAPLYSPPYQIPNRFCCRPLYDKIKVERQTIALFFKDIFYVDINAEGREG